jgi:hypothetical protein
MLDVRPVTDVLRLATQGGQQILSVELGGISEPAITSRVGIRSSKHTGCWLRTLLAKPMSFDPVIKNGTLAGPSKGSHLRK